VVSLIDRIVAFLVISWWSSAQIVEQKYQYRILEKYDVVVGTKVANDFDNPSMALTITTVPLTAVIRQFYCI